MRGGGAVLVARVVCALRISAAACSDSHENKKKMVGVVPRSGDANGAAAMEEDGKEGAAKGGGGRDVYAGYEALSFAREGMEVRDDDDEATAIGESGHTLIALLLPSEVFSWCRGVCWRLLYALTHAHEPPHTHTHQRSCRRLGRTASCPTGTPPSA